MITRIIIRRGMMSGEITRITGTVHDEFSIHVNPEVQEIVRATEEGLVQLDIAGLHEMGVENLELEILNDE